MITSQITPQAACLPNDVNQNNEITPKNITNQISPHLEKEGILSVEECNNLPTVDLIHAMNDKHKSFQTYLNDIRNITDSHDYSVCLRKLEKIEETVRNMLTCLASRKIHYDKNIIESMHQSIQKTQLDMPVGHSILLQSDITKLVTVATISDHDYYITEMGKFCEPKISQFYLLSYFEKFKKEQGYKSYAIGWKVSNFYGKPLNTMCSYIAFEKNKSQKNQVWVGMMHDGMQFVTDFCYGKESNNQQLSREVKSQDEIFSNALNRLVPELKEQAEKWQFSYYKLISYNELKNDYHLSAEDAKKHDFIIFYHKKDDDKK
jgi:hypothetical protein